MKRKDFIKLASVFALLIVTCSLLTVCSNPFFPAKSSNDTPATAEDVQELIEDAEDLLDEINISTDGSDVGEDDWWVTQEDWDALQDAIKKAEEDIAAGEKDLDEILAELQDAIDAFENAKRRGSKPQTTVEDVQELIEDAEDLLDEINISTDGGDVGEDDWWVTQEDLDALEDAIKKAEDDIADGEKSLDEILDELQDAIDAFERAKRRGSKPVYAIVLDIHGAEEGDIVTLGSDTGGEGSEIAIGYTVANTSFYNQLYFSGIAETIAEVTEHGDGERVYTIDADDASDGVIIITATFLHTELELDPIAFTNPEEHITVTYGDLFTNAITDAHEGSGAISYSSSDTEVAAVNNSGIVTVLKAGSTVITAEKAADDVYVYKSR